MLDYPYVYRWNVTWMRPINRKGQLCRVLARGKRNTVALEFEDGFTVTTSAWAIRKHQLDGAPSLFSDC